MTMFILAICVRMCQINIYWGLGIEELGNKVLTQHRNQPLLSLANAQY
ncbi:hypothetical protein [Nostoc sp.]